MKRIAVALALLLLPMGAATARAAYDPLGSGTTKLSLDKGFASFLKHDGVALSAMAPARRRGLAISLPVSGGNLDPTTGKGEVDQVGALAFEAKGKRLPLRDLTVKTSHSPLIAKVGGGQLKLATSARLSSGREGFTSAFRAKQLRLTAKAATRLNKKLRPKTLFAGGQILGSLVSKPQPRLVTVLPQGRATLAFDPAFVAKLDSHFVSLTPIFPAEHQGSTFTFPIVLGGAIAPDAGEGTLRTGGDIEFLQLGGGQVFWHELWLDLGARIDSAEVEIEPTPAFPGKLGRIGVFDLGTSAVSSDPAARAVTVSAVPPRLAGPDRRQLQPDLRSGQRNLQGGRRAGDTWLYRAGAVAMERWQGIAWKVASRTGTPLP